MTWQELITLAIVIAAAAYLARRSWLAIAGQRKAGCGSCGTCPENRTGDEEPLVQIGSKPDR